MKDQTLSGKRLGAFWRIWFWNCQIEYGCPTPACYVEQSLHYIHWLVSTRTPAGWAPVHRLEIESHVNVNGWKWTPWPVVKDGSCDCPKPKRLGWRSWKAVGSKRGSSAGKTNCTERNGQLIECCITSGWPGAHQTDSAVGGGSSWYGRWAFARVATSCTWVLTPDIAFLLTGNNCQFFLFSILNHLQLLTVYTQEILISPSNDLNSLSPVTKSALYDFARAAA